MIHLIAGRTRCVGVVVVGGLAAAAANAQDTWVRQAPLPTNRNLTGAYFVTPDHGFVSGLNQHLLETTDGGGTWTLRHGGEYGADPYYNVYFSDETRGFVIGNNNMALRSVDGGVTWTAMDGVPSGSWSHIDFLSALEGFIGANGAVAHTSDAGETWDVRSGYPNCPVIYGMDFKDVTVGLAAGYQIPSDQYGVFRTADGGRTWSRTLSGICNDAIFVGGDRALAIGGSGYRIYESSDAGQTWAALSPPFGGDGPVDLDAFDENVILGVSGGGDLWRSANGGASWTKTFEGLGALPAKWSVRTFPSGHAWAAGDLGLLLKSTDRGETWRVITSGVAMELEDIEMFSDHYGLSAHYNGYLCRTTDGGRRWEVQKLEVTGQQFGRDEGLSAVHILDANFAAAAGPGGVVFKSLNAGVTWESIGYPNLSEYFEIADVAFPTPMDGWVVGIDYGSYTRNVFETHNGGTTWEESPIAAESFYSAVEFMDPLQGWAQSLGNEHFRTIDGGHSWRMSTLPNNAFGNPTIEDMDYVDSNTGWACGWWGYMAKTTNSGQSWQIQSVGADIRVVLDVVGVSPTEAWAVAVTESPDLEPVILHTITGGSSWSRQYVGNFPEVLSEVSASPAGNVWVGGFDGVILGQQPAARRGLRRDHQVQRSLPQRQAHRQSGLLPAGGHGVDPHAQRRRREDPDDQRSWQGEGPMGRTDGRTEGGDPRVL